MAKTNYSNARAKLSACKKLGTRKPAAVSKKTPSPDYLEKLHADAMAAFADDELVTPGTPEALTEFK